MSTQYDQSVKAAGAPDSAPETAEAGKRAAPAPGIWAPVLVITGALLALSFAMVSVVLGDLEAGAYAAGTGLATAWLHWRRSRIPALLLALASLNALAWMGVGAFSNVGRGVGLTAAILPSLLGGLSLVVLLASGALLLRPADRSMRGPIMLATVAALIAGALATAGLVSRDPVPVGAADLVVEADNVLFPPDVLQAEAGAVTVRLRNHDLFWHTFTIDELDVDLWAPAAAERGVSFDAPPGTYTFYCRIPGHERRMQGTLEVG